MSPDYEPLVHSNTRDNKMKLFFFLGEGARDKQQKQSNVCKIYTPTSCERVYFLYQTKEGNMSLLGISVSQSVFYLS